MAPIRWQAIISTNDGLVCWRIYASHGLKELKTWVNGQGHSIRKSDDFYFGIQWNPYGKARNVSLKLQNLIHIYAPFFTNHVYFTPHDRPPLLKGHHHGWPLQRGSTVSECRYRWYLLSCMAEYSSFIFVIFKLIFRPDILTISCDIVSQVNATRLQWLLINIGSGDGWMLSGDRPLTEPVLNKFFDTIWLH